MLDLPQFKIGLPTPLPSIQLGLLGAITPLKSPPPNIKSMFDFAISGPLTGITASVCFLVGGLAMTAAMDFNQAAELPALPVFLLRSSALGGGLIELFLGKGVLTAGLSADTVLPMHPFAIAGFLGIITNALALLPLGSKCYAAYCAIPSYRVSCS
jgi:membrane-associated protease RseP (regulator of RpoE activity)